MHCDDGVLVDDCTVEVDLLHCDGVGEEHCAVVEGEHVHDHDHEQAEGESHNDYHIDLEVVVDCDRSNYH